MQQDVAKLTGKQTMWKEKYMGHKLSIWNYMYKKLKEFSYVVLQEKPHLLIHLKNSNKKI